MKKILAIILCLFILSGLAACKSNDDISSSGFLTSNEETSQETSSESFSEASSTETTASKTDTTSTETSTEVDTSSEESKVESESKEKTESKETTSKNSNSKKNTSSKKENSSKTTSSTKPKEKTYFEKHNLKISPLSTNVCFNDKKGHVCGKHKTISITKCNLTKKEYEHYDIHEDTIKKGKIDTSKYNCVFLKTYNGIRHDDYTECFEPVQTSYVFDKYTGTLLPPHEWKKITYKEKTYKLMSILDGAGGGETDQSVYCPKAYNGLVFCMTKNLNYDIFDDGKTHYIHEVIDFEKDKYYLFSPTGK